MLFLWYSGDNRLSYKIFKCISTLIEKFREEKQCSTALKYIITWQSKEF